MAICKANIPEDAVFDSIRKKNFPIIIELIT